MANIHQTMKRVAALYEDLLGTREELTRCSGELQRWQREVSTAAVSLTEDIERLGRTIQEQQKQIDATAARGREQWGWVLMAVAIGGASVAIFLEKAFSWLLARF